MTDSENKDIFNQAHEQELETYLCYLDSLRESGVTNMFGAATYLVSEFGLSKPAAKEILKTWMETFTERHING